MRSTTRHPNGLIVTRHLTRASFEADAPQRAPRPVRERTPSPRPPYEDLRPEQLAGGHGYDVVEPKHDGWWATVHVAGGIARLVSRRGRELGRLPVAVDVEAVLCAEYLVGTTRAARSPLHRQLVVFDCLALAGEDLREEPLSTRRQAAAQVVALLGAPFHQVDQVPTAEAPD